MKKLFTFAFLLAAVNLIVAQPGGQAYTLGTLSTLLPSAIQTVSPHQFRIVQDVYLEAGDTLLLETADELVLVNNGVTIHLFGTLLTQERTSPLLIQGDSTQSNHFELRFEEAPTSHISHVHVQFCKKMSLISSDIVIDSCEFDHFSEHVISYMNCNPVIRNSYFHDNQACAIQSAVNAGGCPKILNNVFYNNVLGNANTPQINIGPGTADTILIVGNRIEGVASNMSGGIGIMNMYNTGVTKVRLQNNVIKNNRYGYTQNGYRISSEILDNQFVDNNLEVTPNNGGSGISIYGYDATCAAKMRRNLITGNLWGVTAIYYHNVDMGTAEDPGYNVLYNNGNGGVDYELYNNASSNMTAVGNYWGCDNDAAAETVIYHQPDNATYGLVNYLPIYVLEPEITTFAFLKENNPSLCEEVMEGEFSSDGDSILFYVACTDADLSNLKPTITKPTGVSISPSESEGQNYDNGSVVYTASTPHGTSRSYTVHIYNTSTVPDNILTNINLSPNPVSDGYFLLDNPTEEVLTWQIFTSAGQCVARGNAQPGANRITTKTLKPGTYLVYIQKGKTFLTKKLIVR